MLPVQTPAHQPAQSRGTDRKCWHCGRVAADVQPTVSVLNDRAIYLLMCEDRSACWRRWDQAHGL